MNIAKQILQEFESLYTGDPSQTMKICGIIADNHGFNHDRVADFVYINRYQDEIQIFISEEIENV